MKNIIFDVSQLDKEILGQLSYSIYFVDKKINNIIIKEDNLIIEHESDKENLIKEKINELIERYSNNEFAFKKNIAYNNSVEVPFNDNIMEILIEKKIIKELDLGVYIFREPFVSILKFLDDFIVKNGSV